MSYREVRPQIPSSDESGDDNLPNSRHSSTSLCDNDIVSGLHAYPARREHDIHIIGPELSSDENVDCLSLLKQNPHNDDGNYAVVLKVNCDSHTRTQHHPMKRAAHPWRLKRMEISVMVGIPVMVRRTPRTTATATTIHHAGPWPTRRENT
ncbi:hypothetical protein B0H14DRAFT_2847923 [Mycena olivaceomarginata]|nr:hypothetical protein B0H14DRAFT_2847923 [Mycena olivaceomarginata]